MSVRRGFTLIELMVVITIIAILSIVGIVVYTNIAKSARMSTKRSDIEAISKAYETNFDGSKYPALTKDNFAGGAIPTPYPGGSYFVAGPNFSALANQNFMVCASLIDDSQCFSSSTTCFCKTSTQGSVPVDTFSLGNPVVNGNFETGNTTNTWNFDCNAGGYCGTGSIVQSDNNGSILPKEGNFMQKVIAPAYAGIGQKMSNLKPNTTYKLTAWIYAATNNSMCPYNPGPPAVNGVSVGVGLFNHGTRYTYCSQANNWVEFTDQGKLDSTEGTISFGNWGGGAPIFYVDAIRLEEVK